ncbi:MAG: hypothetical protein AAF805_06770 [Planctomycetota bacterium]
MELLVVIAIIALLAALITAAAAGALRTARQARIRAEMDQINTALEDYKNTRGSYPPDTQTDGDPEATAPIDDLQVQRDFLRHFKQAFPNSREPDWLLQALIGRGTGTQVTIGPAAGSTPGPNLPGGMTAAESLVFWLSLGQDAKYPISGQGGPAYVVAGTATNVWHEQDPIETRNWALDINLTQLGPRRDDGFFAHVHNTSPTQWDRYIEYADPRDNTRTLRLNFWRLLAAGSPMPYLYFDASRGAVEAETDAPAHTLAGTPTGPDQEVMQAIARVHAIKEPGTTSNGAAFRWANGDKFQLLHAGLDESFGVFPRVDWQNTSPPETPTPEVELDSNITFNEGPWTLDLADTLTNFSDGTLEDAQP